jgi:hypothetical protein
MAMYSFLPITFKIPDATRNEGQVQAFAIHIDQTSFAPSEHSSLAWLNGLIIEMMHVSNEFWSNFSRNPFSCVHDFSITHPARTL